MAAKDEVEIDLGQDGVEERFGEELDELGLRWNELLVYCG